MKGSRIRGCLLDLWPGSYELGRFIFLLTDPDQGEKTSIEVGDLPKSCGRWDLPKRTGLFAFDFPWLLQMENWPRKHLSVFVQQLAYIWKSLFERYRWLKFLPYARHKQNRANRITKQQTDIGCWKDRAIVNADGNAYLDTYDCWEGGGCIQTNVQRIALLPVDLVATIKYSIHTTQAKAFLQKQSLGRQWRYGESGSKPNGQQCAAAFPYWSVYFDGSNWAVTRVLTGHFDLQPYRLTVPTTKA